MSRGPRKRSTSATGAASRKVQREPISVSAPPRTRPSEKPLAPTVVKMLSVRFRAGPPRRPPPRAGDLVQPERGQDLLDRLVDGLAADPDVGRAWRLVRVVDAGEAGDLAGAGLR